MNILVQVGGLIIATFFIFQQTVANNLNSGEVLGTISNISTNSIMMDLLIYVGKDQPLPKGYAPNDLVNLKSIGYPSYFVSQKAFLALTQLINASREQGLNLKILSTYRSYITQENLFNSYAKQFSEEVANTFSARAGFSEHQLGTTIDFGTGNSTDFTDQFGVETEGVWLMENAHRYGFILSYPKDKVDETGYKYEPWHFRFVGEEVATICFQNQWLLKDYQANHLNMMVHSIKNSVLGLGGGGFLQ